ncbi:MAG: thioredoxin-like domain-containing protein [Bacteroidota bacterium]|nr:thioredoxin-like domain-containing protein [Bacteroidota bacterium]
MSRLIFSLFLLTGISICTGAQLNNGYEINVIISGLQDSSIYLAYHLGDKQYVKDTVKLNSLGSGVFIGNEHLPEGIYMIVLPGRKYFEMLMSADQYFSVSCSIKDYQNTLKFTGSDENTAFIDYQRRWTQLQNRASAITKRLQNNRQNPDSLRILSGMQKTQEDSMVSYLHGVAQENKGSLLAVLVKAMLPVEVPPVIIPPGAKNPDSLRWFRSYLYNKNHFFDNIDLNDERLVRTPILQARLNTFFTNVVIQSPDSINREIDKLINKVKNNHAVFQFVSVFLFNHFRESEVMGHDAVVVKLADDIYLSGKADWVNNEFKDELRKEVDLIRPNLIGKKAHNLVMDSYKGIFVSLYDVEKDFIVLYFWEPNCGHCQEATPKLKAWYEKAKNTGIEVFTVCTTADREKWEKYIEDNKLTWINGWDPERKSNFGYYYNVTSTPMVYILDRNKTIIAKKLSVEDIGPFIDNYRKYFRK